MTERYDPRDTDLAARVGSALGHRVDHVTQAPLSFQDVRGRARSIRRRRVGAAIGGAVVVAAALLPVALLSRTDQPDRGVGPVTQRPEVTRSATVEASGFAYVQGRTVHTLDGTVVRVGGAGLTPYDFVELRDGRVVVEVSTSSGATSVQVISSSAGADGAIEQRAATYPLSGRVVTDAARRGAAWVTPDGVPMVLTEEAGKPFELPRVSGSAPSAVALQGTTCTVYDANCAVVVDSGDGTVDSASVSVSPLGTTMAYPTGLLALTDLSPDGKLVSGSAVIDDDGGCGAVRDLASGRQLWRSCDLRELRFSPDGAYVSAIPAATDGLGPSSATVLDARTGEEVLSVTQVDVVAGMVWARDGSLLAEIHDDEGWSIHRYRIFETGARPTIQDDSLVDSLPGGVESAPYVLPTS